MSEVYDKRRVNQDDLDSNKFSSNVVNTTAMHWILSGFKKRTF